MLLPRISVVIMPTPINPILASTIHRTFHMVKKHEHQRIPLSPVSSTCNVTYQILHQKISSVTNIVHWPLKKLPEYCAGGGTMGASRPSTDFMTDSRAARPYCNTHTHTRQLQHYNSGKSSQNESQLYKVAFWCVVTVECDIYRCESIPCCQSWTCWDLWTLWLSCLRESGHPSHRTQVWLSERFRPVI